jgi:hypothetical protein
MKKLVFAVILFSGCAGTKENKTVLCTVVSHHLVFSNHGNPNFITVVKCNGNVDYTSDLNAYEIPIGSYVNMRFDWGDLMVAK